MFIAGAIAVSFFVLFTVIFLLKDLFGKSDPDHIMTKEAKEQSKIWTIVLIIMVIMGVVVIFLFLRQASII